METINLDAGLREYRCGSGVLRFNPTDPNIYARFLEALEPLSALEAELKATEKPVLEALRDADSRVKAILGQVFGPGNDMDAIFGGMNLLSVGGNGQRLLTNFLAAIEPILADGARRCAAAEAEAL